MKTKQIISSSDAHGKMFAACANAKEITDYSTATLEELTLWRNHLVFHAQRQIPRPLMDEINKRVNEKAMKIVGEMKNMSHIGYCKRGGMDGIVVTTLELQQFAQFMDVKYIDKYIPLPDM